MIRWLMRALYSGGLTEREYGPALGLPLAPEPAPLPGVLSSFNGPLESIPASRAAMVKVYGHPGVRGLSKRWERENMVLARDLPGPFPRRYVHRLMEPYLREALRRCERSGCADEIRRLGVFNYRRMRHDTIAKARAEGRKPYPLSDHAFGVAVDINPRQNRAKEFPGGDGPKPFTDDWRDLWPDGLSEQLVSIFEAVGFEWGGRWRTIPDPMHFSLRRR